MPIQAVTLDLPPRHPIDVQFKRIIAASDQHELNLSALVSKVAALPTPLTLEQIRQALSATGSNPLNVTSLIGAASASGTAAILVGTHAERRARNTAHDPDHELFVETDRFALYEFRKATGLWTFRGNLLGPMTGTVFSVDQRPTDLGPNDVGFIFEGSDANGAWWQWSGTAWVFVIGTGVPVEVTLNPSTLPALTVHDVGFAVWATDYHRLYLWSGAAWAEGEHNDARYQIGAFNAVPDQNGWFKCDGSVVNRSTSVAGVTAYTTPDLITANRFIQMSAAAGATGGNPTHHHSVDPPATTSTGPTPNTSGGPTPNVTSGPTPNATGAPSATTTVDHTLAGATIAVGSATHTHDLGAHTHDLGAHTHDLANHTHSTDIAAFNSADTTVLPPWYGAIPYIRL